MRMNCLSLHSVVPGQFWKVLDLGVLLLKMETWILEDQNKEEWVRLQTDPRGVASHFWSQMSKTKENSRVLSMRVMAKENKINMGQDNFLHLYEECFFVK